MTGGTVALATLVYALVPDTSRYVIVPPPDGALVLQGDGSWTEAPTLGDAISGTVVVLPTSGGLAASLFFARFNALIASFLPLPVAVGQTTAPYSTSAPASASIVAIVMSQIQAAATGIATQAVADGNVLVTYIQANATVVPGSLAAVVSTTTSVGAMPFAIATGEPIAPPATPVDLPLTGSGTIS